MSDYENAAGRLAIRHLSDRMFACKNCGHPVIKSYICTNCKDGSPNSPTSATAPEYSESTPAPPARCPRATYALEMRDIAKRSPHLIEVLKLQQYVEPESAP